LHASQGAWTAAEHAIEHAQSGVDHLTSSLPLAFLHQIQGFLASQREDYATAEREFLAADANAQKGSIQLMFLTSLLGLTSVALGKREEAFTSIAQLEALLAELPAGGLPTAPILLCLALMAIALNDQQRMKALYPKLLAFRGQHYWFLVDRVLGELATLCGDWKMATIHLEAAEARAQSEELRPELARTILAQAKLEMLRGRQDGPARATELLNRAYRLFQKLNLTNAVDSVRQLLSTLSRRQHSSTLRSLPVGLTSSEAKVLHFVVQGKSNRQIAQELQISEKTVANHLSHIFYKTGSDNRAAAAAFAIRHGLG
jgi:DNA-binding CsgD family transcriptional regulator